MNKNVLTSTNLIAKCTYNNGCNAAFLEVRNDLELWVYGKIYGKFDARGPEVKIDLKLSPEVFSEIVYHSSWNFPWSVAALVALRNIWREAARLNSFFKGVGNYKIENTLLARRSYNGGQNVAFLEVRNASDFWVYGKFYDFQGVRGPEVKIDLKLSAQAKEELLLRTSWVDPMSQSVRNSVLKAWKLAAQQHPFFKNLVMCMN